MWRRRLADLAFVAMEALALFVLGSLVAGIGSRRGPSAFSVLAAAFAGFFLARALERFDLPRRLLVGLGACASLIGLWLLGSIQYGGVTTPFDFLALAHLAAEPMHVLDVHSAEVVGMIVLGVAWLRGVLAGAHFNRSHSSVFKSLSIGLGIVAIGLSFGRASISSQAIDQAAVPFFVAGLLTLALVHLSQSEHIQGDSWRGPWLFVLAGTTAMLSLVAAVAGLLPLEFFNRLLAPVGVLLLLAVDLCIYALALPVVIVVNWILVHALGGRLHRIDFPVQPASAAGRQLQHQAHRSGFALMLVDLGHFLLLLGVAGGIALILWWVFRRLQRAPPEEDLARESVRIEADLSADLRAAFADMRRRFVRRRASEPPLSSGILAVRRLYLALLRRAEARGLARPPATTPNEFAPELRSHFGSASAGSLSHWFSAGRYGLRELPQDALTRLREEIEHAAK